MNLFVKKTVKLSARFNETEISYLEGGNGRIIFLVHGWSQAKESCLNLARALGNFRVIIPDLPGFGESKAVPSKYQTLDSYVEILEEIITVTSGSNEVFGLYGHSMGSVLIVGLLERGKIKVKKVAMNALPILGVKLGNKLKNPINALVFELLYRTKKHLPSAIDRKLAKYFTKGIDASEPIDDEYVKIKNRADIKTSIKLAIEMSDINLSRNTFPAKVKVMILQGTEDRYMSNSEIKEYVNKKGNIDFVEMIGPHDLMHSTRTRDKFNKIISSYFEQ